MRICENLHGFVRINRDSHRLMRVCGDLQEFLFAMILEDLVIHMIHRDLWGFIRIQEDLWGLVKIHGVHEDSQGFTNIHGDS